MKITFNFLITIYLLYNVEGFQIVWDNSVDFDFNDFDISARSEEVRIPNSFFIYPGTKWCGAGNIAANDSDFGPQRNTDKCCRNHDFCPDIIEGYQTKYNLTNPSFYTRLKCDCDSEFYKCLKSINTKTSSQVGHIYFTVLGTQCYKKEYPINGCNKYTYFPYQKRWGIDVGETNVLVHVQVMTGRRYVFSPNGRLTLEKQFATNTANYPLQTVVFDIAVYDIHASVFRDVENVFPEGCTCFTLTNPYYGSQGTVQKSKDTLVNGRLKICISVPEEPDFTKVKEVHAKVIRGYRNSYNAATLLSMTNLLFSRITGSIFITAKNNEGGFKNVNIGLDLKFNKKNKETPGYTKKIGNTWFYTDRAIELVRLYSETYPEIFEYLCRNDNTDDINVENVFGENCDEKVKELLSWLKSLPVQNLERQTCGSEVVEPEVVEEIEKIVDEYPKTGNAKKVTMQIKPNFLYRPELQTGTLMPDPKTETKILDRIVNVRSGFSVPLGLKGTVISIHKPTNGTDRDIMYDVVFDKPFNGGMKLNCSENRGYRLPKTAIINISYGKRLLVERTGQPGELIARAEASQMNPFNLNNSNNYNKYKAPNFLYNFTQQQQYIQQEPQSQMMWRSPQLPPHYSPLQNQQPFQKENSAFAQVSSSTGQRQLYTAQQQNNAQVMSIIGQRQVYTVAQQNDDPVQNNHAISIRPAKQQNFPQQQRQQSNQNGFAGQGSFTYQRANNNFMPNFSNKQQENSKPIRQSPEKPPPSVQKKLDGNKGRQVESLSVRPTVNTEILRAMLKIGKDNKNTRQNRKVDVVVKSTASNSVKESPKQDKEENKDSVSFDMFAQAAKAPASVRLLTYYQSNGLGLPRYQYFNSGKTAIQSQLTLPSGDVVTGKEARTKEEASENVAMEALEIFMKKTKGDDAATQMSESFPTPPETWVKPEVNKGNSQDDNQQNVNQQTDDKETRTAIKTKTDATVLNNSFVPLQAVKNHISKVNNTTNRQSADDTTLRESTEIPRSTNISDVDNKDNQKEQNTENERKPRRGRKTRIAANFVIKN